MCLPAVQGEGFAHLDSDSNGMIDRAEFDSFMKTRYQDFIALHSQSVVLVNPSASQAPVGPSAPVDPHLQRSTTQVSAVNHQDIRSARTNLDAPDQVEAEEAVAVQQPASENPIAQIF